VTEGPTNPDPGSEFSIQPDPGPTHDEDSSPKNGGDGAYRVELDVFSGPLDLLLHLIKKEEIDIYDIPISKVLDQFIAHLEVLRLMELDEVGDFLVMAANLMLIKARMLVPQAVDLNIGEDEVEDPRTELVQKLLDYKRYKEAAIDLEARRSRRAHLFGRGKDRDPERSDPVDESEELKVELWDLVEAFARIVREVGAGKDLIPFKADDRPVREYMEEVVGRLHRRGPFLLESLFEGGVSSRSQVISYFMAILELMRKGDITAVQEKPFGQILIKPPTEKATPRSGKMEKRVPGSLPAFEEAKPQDVLHESMGPPEPSGPTEGAGGRQDPAHEDIG